MRRPFEKRQNGDGPQKRRSPNPSPSLCLPRARRKAARRWPLSSSPRRASLRRISEATGRRILPIPVRWRRLVRLQAVLPFKLYFPKRFVAWAVSPILGASARRRARRGVEAFLRERTMRWRIRPGLILKSSAMGPKGAFSLARFVFFLGGAGLVGIGRIGPGRRLRPKRAHRIALESGDEGASTLAGAAHFFPAPFVARNVLFILVAFWLFNVLGLIQESADSSAFWKFFGDFIGAESFSSRGLRSRSRDGGRFFIPSAGGLVPFGGVDPRLEFFKV